MTQPQTIDLPAVYVGTTWEGINSIELDQPNGDPLDLTNAQLSMTYRRVGGFQNELVLGIGSGIALTNAAAGIARVNSQVLPLTPGTFYWEMILTHPTLGVVPLFVGTQEITRIGVNT